MSSKHPREPDFTEEQKQVWLEWGERQKKKRKTWKNVHSVLVSLPSAPSPRTLRLWRQQEEQGKLTPSSAPHGPVSTLTQLERNTIIGKVIHRLKEHRAITILVISNFLSASLNKPRSHAWISTFLCSSGFSGQIARSTPPARIPTNLESRVTSFLTTVRKQLEELGGPSALSRLVAVDETSFWDNSIVLCSYAVQGR
jgi:hypothetical protein